MWGNCCQSWNGIYTIKKVRTVKLKFPDFTNLTLAQVLTVINIHLKEKKLKARKAPLSYKYRFCLSEVVLEYLKYKGNTNI